MYYNFDKFSSFRYRMINKLKILKVIEKDEVTYNKKEEHYLRGMICQKINEILGD